MVLVVGRFLRMAVDNASHRIIYEDMPYVQALLNLVGAIYLARERGELDLEEDLFRLLVRLYRSPESLILWTEPALKPRSL